MPATTLPPPVQPLTVTVRVLPNEYLDARPTATGEPERHRRWLTAERRGAIVYDTALGLVRITDQVPEIQGAFRCAAW